jgi:hypothetical protein
MTQEALKLAFQTLELSKETMESACKQIDELKAENKALKEALAQAEPFGYFKAEPFGWTDCAETDEGAIALYQAPPQRTWVGLTDEGTETLIHRFDGDSHTLLDEVNARLKEQNT